MKAPSIASRIILFVVSTMLIALSATLAWGVAVDYQARGLVSNGVYVVGRDLSGMSETQARAVIEEAVSTPLLRPVTVTGDGKTWTLDPQGIVTVDADSMIASAYSPRRTATILTRLNSQLTGEQIPADIKPAYAVDSNAIAAWVAQMATEVNRKSVDSTRTIVKYKFKVTRSVVGATVDQAGSAGLIAAALSVDAALSSTDRVVALQITSIKPKVTETSFKTAIIVSLSQCRIRLFRGAKLIKAYRTAPGRAGFPTPTGDFVIQSKLRYAPWYNPGTDWAKSMPKVIPGGPGNPMGVTKIGINYSGVFMHGVPPGEYGSIGTHASHGCMRMMPDDVLDMYGRVKIGQPVFIRP